MEMTFRYGTFPLRRRLFLYASLGVLGVVIQAALLYSGSGFFPAFASGAAVMIAGMFPLSARPYTNRPHDLGFEDWQPSSAAEIDRIASNIRLTRAAKLPFYYRKGVGVVAVTAFGMLSVFFGVFAELPLPSLVTLDAILLFWPVLFFGSVDLFVPQTLRMKLETFRPVLSAHRPDSIVVTPYLRLDRDPEGKTIPEDMRIMLEPRRKPDDFLGAQVQVAVNKGPNGNVPYMYAVFLTVGSGKSFRTLSNRTFGDFVVERNADGEYGTIVVRQETSGTGYHTTEADCLRLHSVVVDTLSAIM